MYIIFMHFSYKLSDTYVIRFAVQLVGRATLNYERYSNDDLMIRWVS